jgi:hypothetical protein
MDGLDDAAPIDALRRRLRWIRPPTASVAFRRQAWRDFEHALDPLGAPSDVIPAMKRPNTAQDLGHSASNTRPLSGTATR